MTRPGTRCLLVFLFSLPLAVLTVVVLAVLFAVERERKKGRRGDPIRPTRIVHFLG